MTAGARAAGPDRPAASALPPGLGPWGHRVAQVHGLVSGRPLREVSLHDFPSMEYGDNFFLAGGYGAYLARLAEDLPIALSRPVTGIDWSGAGVTVATESGPLRARAAIVTVPVMVLRQTIPFTPALPPEIRAAIDGFSTGIYEHAVLHWPGSPFRGPDRLVSMAGGRQAPPGLLSRIDGSAFHFYELDTVGAAAVDAAGGDADAARRHVRQVLGQHFPAAALRGLTIPAVSAWRHDPWSRGSWAVVPPGHAGARSTLQAPVSERIWFAGEALSRLQWGTAGGAFEEGRRAGLAAAERIRAGTG